MRSCAVSGGGANTAAPHRPTSACVSRSCQGAVRTTTGSRSGTSASSSSGTASGSKNSRRSPSSIAYDDTSCRHRSPGVQSGCGACQCQSPARSSRTAPGYATPRMRPTPPVERHPLNARLRRYGLEAAECLEASEIPLGLAAACARAVTTAIVSDDLGLRVRGLPRPRANPRSAVRPQVVVIGWRRCCLRPPPAAGRSPPGLLMLPGCRSETGSDLAPADARSSCATEARGQPSQAPASRVSACLACAAVSLDGRRGARGSHGRGALPGVPARSARAPDTPSASRRCRRSRRGP
jgi:hypothetical protein